MAAVCSLSCFFRATFLLQHDRSKTVCISTCTHLAVLYICTMHVCVCVCRSTFAFTSFVCVCMYACMYVTYVGMYVCVCQCMYVWRAQPNTPNTDDYSYPNPACKTLSSPESQPFHGQASRLTMKSRKNVQANRRNGPCNASGLLQLYACLVHLQGHNTSRALPSPSA